MPITRDRMKGLQIVARAMRYDLIPEFKKNTHIKEQTFNTQWALHVLAVMSKEKKPDIADVKRVIEETKDVPKNIKRLHLMDFTKYN